MRHARAWTKVPHPCTECERGKAGDETSTSLAVGVRNFSPFDRTPSMSTVRESVYQEEVVTNADYGYEGHTPTRQEVQG